MADSKGLVIGPGVVIPFDEFDFTYARGSGPGGQNVNKVNSKAVMFWSFATSPSVPDGVRARFRERFGMRLTLEGVLVMTSDRFRDQKRNTEDCLEKLAEMLKAVLVPPKPRKKTKPSRGSIERRLSGKRATAEKKQRRRPSDD